MAHPEAELNYLSVMSALALFRAKELSPVELLAAVSKRTEAIEASVNPFADKYFEQGFERARQSEARYAKGKPRRFEGIHNDAFAN